MKLTSLTLSFGLLMAAIAAPVKPNIVMILVDDLGWQDVKCYDIDEPSPMETPNMDALAKRGVQFWQAYSPAPTCAPSRCAIMSGVHPARAQKTHVVGGDLPIPGSARSTMITPWYSGRIVQNTPTLAQSLKTHGYKTGHTGKWHIARNHHDDPQPKSLGFDFTTHIKGQDSRGVQTGMKNRLEEFSTSDPNSSYPLDSNGYPTDPVTEESLKFMEKSKDEPFFLYNATWLVHTPIQSRSRELLEKYCEKLNQPFPTDQNEKYTTAGQINPYYCAMVETLDYYVGKVVNYLDQTDDPRNPGQKLSENTYIIFTSDNGGMEGSSKKGVITDNFPLDRGKLSAKEGGVRVPFLIAGPEIKGGVESNVMINGLDLYPTILNWVGAQPQEGQVLDGSDLSSLLKKDAKNPELVINAQGSVRDTMFWHYPHPSHSCSTIRVQGQKLLINYGAEYNPKVNDYELYELYAADGSRVDIEEKKDVSEERPEQVKLLQARLNAELDQMIATRPYKNPKSPHTGEQAKQVPTVTDHQLNGTTLTVQFEEKGAKVEKAYLYYTTAAQSKTSEWFRATATVSGASASVELPIEATHGFISLVDENNYLVLHPNVTKKDDMKTLLKAAIALK